MQVSTPQLVFALTTTGADIFAAMTRIAVASLRHSNPGLPILIACDRESLAALQRVRHPLIHEADAWLGIETPPGNAATRNRHVKTSLRETVSGRFLFLDSDVFVRGPLEQLFRLDEDIAAAPNHSLRSWREQLPSQDAEVIASLGWQVDPGLYVNGGVIYYNDTPGARRFALAWHRRWKISSQQLGQYRDQPALNAALHAESPRLHVLSHAYNHQVKWNSGWQERPVIWHYNYTSRDELRTSFEMLAAELQHGAKLDMQRIAAMAEQNHP